MKRKLMDAEDMCANQAVMVVDWLRRERGWRFEAQQSPWMDEGREIRWNVVIYSTDERIIGHASAATLAEAITAAVRRACRGTSTVAT